MNFRAARGIASVRAGASPRLSFPPLRIAPFAQVRLMPDNEYLRQSALAALGLAAKARQAPADEAGVVLRECSHRAQVCLRGGPGADFERRIEEVIGIRSLPESGSSAQHGDTTLLWLGPDEWLAVLPDNRRDGIVSALQDALAPLHAAVVDVSHARAVISLSGRYARSVLRKGCHLDLHPSRFSSGNVAPSRFARCHVLLHQTDDAPAYDLYVQRSFGRYLWSWLEDAAAEYGVAIEN